MRSCVERGLLRNQRVEILLLIMSVQPVIFGRGTVVQLVEIGVKVRVHQPIGRRCLA